MTIVNMDIDLPLVIGSIGSLMVLGAFLLNQMNKWSNEDFSYDLVNFLGSAFLLYFAVATNSIPFILINTVWGLFSLKDLIWRKK